MLLPTLSFIFDSNQLFDVIMPLKLMIILYVKEWMTDTRGHWVIQNSDDIITVPQSIDQLALTRLLVKFILRLWEVTQRQGNSKWCQTYGLSVVCEKIISWAKIYSSLIRTLSIRVNQCALEGIGLCDVWREIFQFD